MDILRKNLVSVVDGDRRRSLANSNLCLYFSPPLIAEITPKTTKKSFATVGAVWIYYPRGGSFNGPMYKNTGLVDRNRTDETLGKKYNFLYINRKKKNDSLNQSESWAITARNLNTWPINLLVQRTGTLLSRSHRVESFRYLSLRQFGWFHEGGDVLSGCLNHNHELTV